jgi:hypothetical protein
MSTSSYCPSTNGREGYELAIAAIRLRKVVAGELPPLHDGEVAELRARVYGEGRA